MLSLRTALLSCLLILLCLPAEASDIRTYPTRLTLSPGAAISSIMVKNNDTSPTAMQIEVMTWSQKDGEDLYEPTRDLLINPVIFELPPGGEQVVRIGLQGGAPGATEKSYRVFMQELPPRAGAAQQSGITTLIRIGIPIFVPPKSIAHDLTWSVRIGADGKLNVEAVNKGSVHIQITALDLIAAGGHSIAKANVFAYLLPGQSRRWEVPPQVAVKAGAQLHLEAATDHEAVKTDVTIGPAEARANP